MTSQSYKKYAKRWENFAYSLSSQNALTKNKQWPIRLMGFQPLNWMLIGQSTDKVNLKSNHVRLINKLPFSITIGSSFLFLLLFLFIRQYKHWE